MEINEDFITDGREDESAQHLQGQEYRPPGSTAGIPTGVAEGTEFSSAPRDTLEMLEKLDSQHNGDTNNMVDANNTDSVTDQQKPEQIQQIPGLIQQNPGLIQQGMQPGQSMNIQQGLPPGMHSFQQGQPQIIRSQMIQQRPQLHNTPQLQRRPLLQNVVIQNQFQPRGSQQQVAGWARLPMSGTPMQGTPMQGTPMQGTPMQGTPMQGTPMQGTPMQGAPMVSVTPHHGGLLGSSPLQIVRPGLIGVRPNFQTLNPTPRPMQPVQMQPGQMQQGQMQPGLIQSGQLQPGHMSGLLQTPSGQMSLIRGPNGQMIPVQKIIHHQPPMNRPQFMGQPQMNIQQIQQQQRGMSPQKHSDFHRQHQPDHPRFQQPNQVHSNTPNHQFNQNNPLLNHSAQQQITQQPVQVHPNQSQSKPNNHMQNNPLHNKPSNLALSSEQPLQVPPPPPEPESQKPQLTKTKGVWKEYKMPDGRFYYFNTATNQTIWTKPDMMKSLAEKIMDNCAWKENNTPDGKSYYYNVTTKETTWQVPAAFQNAKMRAEEAALEEKVVGKDQVADQLVDQVEDQAVNQTVNSRPQRNSWADKYSTKNNNDAEVEPREKRAKSTFTDSENEDDINEKGDNDNSESKNSESKKSDSKKSDLTKKSNTREKTPTFAMPAVLDTPEAKKSAFMALLEECKVNSTSSWESALTKIKHHEHFNVLTTASDRKSIFNEYKTLLIRSEKEKEKVKERETDDKLISFLKKHKDMTSRTSYRMAEKMYCDLPVWADIVDDKHRKEVFEDLVSEMESNEKRNAKEQREKNIIDFARIVHDIEEITYRTSWEEVQQHLSKNRDFKINRHLQEMDMNDALETFQEIIREYESDHMDDLTKKTVLLKRVFRRNRDKFLELLEDLRSSGILNMATTWYSIFDKHLATDKRFTIMLGQSGSTPLDLFKFYIDDMKANFQKHKRIVVALLQIKGINDVQHDLEHFDDFSELLADDDAIAEMEIDELELVYSAFELV